MSSLIHILIPRHDTFPDRMADETGRAEHLRDLCAKYRKALEDIQDVLEAGNDDHAPSSISATG